MCKCEICNREFSGQRYLTVHLKTCSIKQEIKKKQIEDHTCPVCNRYISNHIKEHINVCDGSGTKMHRILDDTRTEEEKREQKRQRNSERTKKMWLNPLYREAITSKLKNASKGIASSHEKEVERKQKISNTMKNNPNAGGLRIGSGRGKKMWYSSPIAGNVYLRSTYEFRYVKHLDEKQISWKGNIIGFPYVWENTVHHYYPDFYLEDENCYVEVKGFKTLKDEAKWKDFPHFKG